MTITFYNETKSNGRFQMMSTEKIEGEGIFQVTKDATAIHAHAGKCFKNLYHYWVSIKAFDKIRTSYELTRTSF